MPLFLFNPEHDLCLSNGSPYYMPPESALRFAREGMEAMRLLYGDDVEVTDAAGLPEWLRSHPAPDGVVPWGWNSALRELLLRLGLPQSLVPSEEQLRQWRRLQHRATLLPLQPYAAAAASVEEVADRLSVEHDLVLKAPWSGAGRGIHWVRDRLTPQEENWIRKTVAAQECVIMERRHHVQYDFALEYMVSQGSVDLMGLSAFCTQSGVYRHNWLEPQESIWLHSGLSREREAELRGWLRQQVAPCYNGPLGIDLYRADEGIFVSEMNLRHTMGMVALRYAQRHPEAEGLLWTPAGMEPSL